MVKATASLGTVVVTADGEGLVSHAGMALLVELADRAGLPRALGGVGGHAGAPLRARPGRVLRDVAVMLADGGDCVTTWTRIEGQERLFGGTAVGDDDASGAQIG